MSGLKIAKKNKKMQAVEHIFPGNMLNIMCDFSCSLSAPFIHSFIRFICEHFIYVSRFLTGCLTYFAQLVLLSLSYFFPCHRFLSSFLLVNFVEIVALRFVHVFQFYLSRLLVQLLLITLCDVSVCMMGCLYHEQTYPHCECMWICVCA